MESRRPGWLDAPGAVLGLTDRERFLGAVPVGLRDAFTGKQVKKGSRFEIGSISKSFAAIVAMQLVEAGLLDLHVPVTDYVPWFEVRSSFGPITAHHLLTHSAGLIIGMDFADDAVPPVWSLRGTSVGFAPGERFRYSNDGYKLLGLILETIGGKPWPDMLRERVLAPLGMDRTDPEITYDTAADIATPHQREANDRPSHRGRLLVRAPISISRTADGSIISTAKDMAAYARMLLNRGAHPGGRLLSEESFALMTTPHMTDTGEPRRRVRLRTRRVRGGRAALTSGTRAAWSATTRCSGATWTRASRAAMMVNGHGEREPSVRFALDAARAHVAGERLPAVPPAPDPLATPLAAELAGEYAAADGSSFLLKDDDGRLVACSAGSGDGEVTLEPLGELWESHDGEPGFAVPAARHGPLRAGDRARPRRHGRRAHARSHAVPRRRRPRNARGQTPGRSGSDRRHLPQLEPVVARVPRVRPRRAAVARDARATRHRSPRSTRASGGSARSTAPTACGSTPSWATGRSTPSTTP